MDVEKLVEKIMFRKKFKKFAKTYSDPMLDAVYPSQYDPCSEYKIVEINGQLWKHFVSKSFTQRWKCKCEFEDMKHRLRDSFVLNINECNIFSCSYCSCDCDWAYDIVYRNKI